MILMLIELIKGTQSTVSEVGGKGYSLIKLTNAGFSVPRGFIISASVFIQTLKENNKYDSVLDLCEKTTLENFRETGIKMREMVLSCKPIFKVEKEITKFNSSVAVRSSSVSEDSSNHSFAGLHDSFLNVEKKDVLCTVPKVWASIFNDRALFYRLHNKMPLFEGVAVLVLEMVHAKYSGVVFTTHPVDPSYLIVEVTPGTCDLLVEGRVTPDRYIFRRDNLTLEECEIVKTPTANKKAMQNIVKECINIEKLFGVPQDIEWAVSDELYFLQSRAVVL